MNLSRRNIGVCHLKRKPADVDGPFDWEFDYAWIHCGHYKDYFIDKVSFTITIFSSWQLSIVFVCSQGIKDVGEGGESSVHSLPNLSSLLVSSRTRIWTWSCCLHIKKSKFFNSLHMRRMSLSLITKFPYWRSSGGDSSCWILYITFTSVVFVRFWKLYFQLSGDLRRTRHFGGAVPASEWEDV